tara:strand:- start:2462 stop:2827 length:366 start_codon:yes stop_codon:yes gene_type:complete
MLKAQNQLTLFAEGSPARTIAMQGAGAVWLATVAHSQDPIHGSVSPALGVTTDGMACLNVTATDNAPRRLTPVECERLQGFPDDWTRYGLSNKPLRKGTRYQMLGNAVTVNVAEWIGQQIS